MLATGISLEDYIKSIKNLVECVVRSVSEGEKNRTRQGKSNPGKKFWDGSQTPSCMVSGYNSSTAQSIEKE